MNDSDWIKDIAPIKQVEQMEAAGVKIEQSMFRTRVIMDITHEDAIELVRAGKKISEDEADENSPEVEVVGKFVEGYLRMLYFALKRNGIDPFED